ncbi:MAG: hypothetical protein JNL77_00680 [Nitrosomonas sp.]|nr:hypothetical protein [Nitrosomonas sp.]
MSMMYPVDNYPIEEAAKFLSEALNQTISYADAMEFRTDFDYNEAVQFAEDFLSKPVLQNDVLVLQSQNKRDDPNGERLYEAIENAAINPDTNDFDMLVTLAATCLRDGVILPEFLAEFIADVLEGKRKRPTKRGTDKYANWARDYALCRAVKEVAKKYELQHYSNNELSEGITAAKIVAKASGHGVDVIVKAFAKFKNFCH